MKYQIGDILGECYEICERIGEGGMSEVFLVQDTHTKKSYAAKIINGKCTNRPDLRDRFSHEAEVLISLGNDNGKRYFPEVQRVILDTHQQIEAIVMELIQGKTLLKVLNEERKLSQKRAITIAINITHTQLFILRCGCDASPFPLVRCRVRRKLQHLDAVPRFVP